MNYINYFLFYQYLIYKIGIGDGDWGLGIGDWGLGIGDWPNPQSPIHKFIIILK